MTKENDSDGTGKSKPRPDKMMPDIAIYRRLQIPMAMRSQHGDNETISTARDVVKWELYCYVAE